MRRRTKILFVHVVDSLIIIASVYFAYLLRFDFQIKESYLLSIPYVMLSQYILTSISLQYFRIYRRLWKYASIGDFISIFKAVFISSILFLAFHHLGIIYFYPYLLVPRSIFVLTGITTFLGIIASRLVWKILKNYEYAPSPNHKKTLIIGAGFAGTSVVRELKQSNSSYHPVAFVDDDPAKSSLEFMGVPVVGNRYKIQEITYEYGIKDIIIALPSAKREQLAEILSICRQTNSNIKIIPNISDVISGKVKFSNIREVSVEDLLGREPIYTDLAAISGYLKNNVIMVTGAGGSIGSELCRQVLQFMPKKIVLLGHGENSIYEIENELKRKKTECELESVIADIQDVTALKRVFEIYRPNVVFHAAAHKHVPLMEKNPVEAVKNNIFGTKNVAELSHLYEVDRFVMVSTDKAVNPTNVMGATKRVAELIIQGLDRQSSTRFSAVRFGNVLGSRGSVVPLFKRQIEEGGPVTVTHPDMIRYFMTIPEAVQLVIQTGALAKGGEVFILDMGNPVKIYDLASDLIRLSGFEPGKDIKIEFTGIRPGEKLFEELLTSEEGTLATKHERIFIGKPSDISYECLLTYLKKLEALIFEESSHSKNDRVRVLLKEMVTNYYWGKDVNQANSNEAIQAALELVASIEKKSFD